MFKAILDYLKATFTVQRLLNSLPLSCIYLSGVLHALGLTLAGFAALGAGAFLLLHYWTPKNP